MGKSKPVAAGTSPAILVIGDVMLDVIAAPERAIELATDTPAAITLLPGGSGANQAAWLGHFGNSVYFIGRVGHQTYAEHAAALHDYRVEPRLAIDEQTRTGVLVTLLGADGERSFLTDRGANANLTRADLADSLLDCVGLVHVSGYALISPGPRAAVRDFIDAAVARGVQVSIDAGSVAFLRTVGPAAFLDWARAATVFFANRSEAALLSGRTEPIDQLARLGQHFAILIVTDGAAGAHATSANGTQHWFVDAPQVTALDCTGAGDAFLAGFLTAYLHRDRIEDCLRRGVAAGTRAVMHYGGRPGVGSRTRRSR